MYTALRRCTYILVSPEKTVYVFESAICGFGVEKIDDRNEQGICQCENNIKFPVQVLYTYGRNFDDLFQVRSRNTLFDGCWLP